MTWSSRMPNTATIDQAVCATACESHRGRVSSSPFPGDGDRVQLDRIVVVARRAVDASICTGAAASAFSASPISLFRGWP
jgi:hypothetical protein